MLHLSVGEKAPHFKGFNEKNETVCSDNFLGKKLILFFYPKDNTPSCTAEVCSLRDSYQELSAKGFGLLGISADESLKHQKFIQKYQLPFSLLADTDLTILQAFGVWGEKKFMGKTYDGIHRTTFVINENGLITHIITKVKTSDHATQILDLYK